MPVGGKLVRRPEEVCLVAAGCFGYLIDFLGRTLFAGYDDAPLARFVRLPGSIGEACTCLWLLIAGVGKPRRVSGEPPDASRHSPAARESTL